MKLSFFLAVVLGIVGCGTSPQSYIDRGNKFFDSGKYEDAALQYQKAIQKSPNLGEAHYRLGLLELQKNNPIPAYRELQRATELMPANTEALSRFGQLALTLYNADPQHPPQLVDQATNIAEKLLAKDPASFGGNLISGALALLQKRAEPAVAYLRKAVQAKPDDLNAKLGLARALVQNNQAAAGEELGREIIRKDKTYNGSYDFLFQQYRASGQTEEALKILKLKVANNPKQASSILELSRYYAASNKPVEMGATLQLLVGNPGTFPTAHQLVGDFYANLGKPDDALVEYQQGLKSADPDKIGYRRKIVRIYAAQKKWLEAQQEVEAILKLQPDDHESKMVRALVWLDEGKPEKLEPAIAELRSQVPKHPEDPLLHFEIANALLKKGDREGARAEWAASSKLNPRYLPPRYALAQLYLDQGKAEDALQISEEILAVTPRDARILLLHATCLTGVGQFQRARTELNRLATQYPKTPEIRFRLGVLAIAERKYKDAEDIFRQLEASGTRGPQVLAALAQSYQGQNEPGKAIQLLQDEIKKTPNAPMLREMLARMAVAGGKYDLAIEQYKQMAAAEPAASGPQVALAAVYTAKGDSQAAIAILKKVSEAEPKNSGVAVQLAQAYVAGGQLDEAKAAYRRILQVQPHDANALNDLAYIMADTGENLDQALALAQRGMEFATAPGLKTSISDTLGWIYLKKKMYDNALQTFQSLVANNPRDPTYRYHLGATLVQTGDKRKAKTELEAALAAKPASSDEPKIRELLSRL